MGILINVALLSDLEIDTRLASSEWHRHNKAIAREWKLKDFAQAIAFVNSVADTAEAANHHPDILIHGWNKVRLTVTNHSAGGLTQADFDLAATLDALPGG